LEVKYVDTNDAAREVVRLLAKREIPICSVDDIFKTVREMIGCQSVTISDPFTKD